MMINSQLRQIIVTLCALHLSATICPASPWAVTSRPEKIGEPYDPPPTETPVLRVPAGSTNLALGATVTSSDPHPIIGNLKMVNDGDRGAWKQEWKILPPTDNWNEDGSIVELLGGGRQYIQLDLQKEASIDAVWIWQRHACEGFEAPCDVIVQISNNAQFEREVSTVFNCDTDNSMGFGTGQDRRYVTSRYGKLIPINAVNGRYVRLWSNGSTWHNTQPGKAPNSWVEVEVYGRPADMAGPLHETPQSEIANSRIVIYGLCVATLILWGGWVFLSKRKANNTP
jgi:hypothetical protein